MTLAADSETWSEIHAQPGIWSNWAPELASQTDELRRWIADAGYEEIIFAGAGTSAFIGEIAAFAAEGNLRLRAVPTTDIVSNPRECLRDDPRLLVVQFGRSGDSSETVGTLDLLDGLFPSVGRLHITCNPGGALATRAPAGTGEQRVLLLPEATHDKGFAMTSSFSTMLLSALACFAPRNILVEALGKLAAKAEQLMPQIDAMTPPRPERIVFLGSGALKGASHEAALKVLELTAGETVSSHEGTLGFRHGPKSVITGADLVVVMIHPDAHTKLYDNDVATEIRAQFPKARVITLGDDAADLDVSCLGDARWDAPLYVLVAQIWAVRWAEALGLNIDNPFVDMGNLSRVVTGVKLYPAA